MKSFTLFSIFLSLLAFSHSEECGEGATWITEGFPRQFLCTEKGVEIFQNLPGCFCSSNPDEFYNLKEKTCMPVTCSSLDCVGKANEAFFTWESSSRDGCECNEFIRRDARTGCMCKNGFCKKDGACVKRDCVHPFYH